MKSQRRHELQTNELADALGRVIAKVKPYGTHVFWGALIVLGGIVALVTLSSRPDAEAGVARAFTRALAGAETAPLETFLVSHPEAPQVPAAKIALGDRLLLSAVRGVESDGEMVDDETARRHVTRAKDFYREAAAASATYRPLAEMKLALVAIQEGNLADGRAKLEAVRDTYPGSAAAHGAAAHLAMLEGYTPVEFSDAPLIDPEPEPELPEPEPAPEPESEPEAESDPEAAPEPKG